MAGAGQGAGCVFGVILGTGVGAGIVLNGKTRLGLNAIAGEWGHNPLPSPRDDERPGPQCYCGRRGCIETFLSGPGFSQNSGGLGSAEQIIAAMRRGEPRASSAFERYTDQLARALAGVINILDPNVIVLGGGLSNIDELYPQVTERLREHVFSDAFTTPIRQAAHGDSSGVRGAAWLWPAGAQ